ncbi:hypothetical protein COO91_08811 [Nostoc flagelliforme CCNUN1]|uniref:Uncharacterized protein n=1 Tax=Nostoc flagelliforme CCNUN1 TaxID=2038116 RepID=A0A2K8T6J2_9NOSO|nr:hypothetical protein [Nostoc flagelliforme]AUB42665.1 hypothetical protein COO91_08811 [Nostoc flagelliforme CCNUN1]
MRKDALLPTKNIVASAKNKAEARCDLSFLLEVSDEDAIRVVGGGGTGGWGHDIVQDVAAQRAGTVEIGSGGWGND